MKSRSFLIALLAVLSSASSRSQCLSAPVMSPCTGAEPLVASGESINQGTTKFYYGATAIFNNLKLNGGTLVVCGDLTVDKFEMDSGVVYVQPGARFVVGNGIGYGLVLKGNSAFYNYGTLEMLRNLSFDNGWASAAKPNLVINATPASIFRMSNQYFVINNAFSWFVNNGAAEFHGLITDPQSPPGAVCLGEGSETKMTVLYNKVRNAYVAPSGSACVAVSEFTQLWDTLTRHPQINMCLGPTHRTDSSCRPYGCKPLAWGQANLFRACSACRTIQLLKSNFGSISVLHTASGNFLRWTFADAVGSFQIERSVDGRFFKSIGTMTAQRQSSYAFVDKDPPAGSVSYRARFTDLQSGAVRLSETVRVEQVLSFAAYPDPFGDVIHVDASAGVRTIQLYDPQGRAVSRKLESSGRGVLVRLPSGLARGIYLLRVELQTGSLTKRMLHL